MLQSTPCQQRIRSTGFCVHKIISLPPGRYQWESVLPTTRNSRHSWSTNRVPLVRMKPEYELRLGSWTIAAAGMAAGMAAGVAAGMAPAAGAPGNKPNIQEQAHSTRLAVEPPIVHMQGWDGPQVGSCVCLQAENVQSSFRNGHCSASEQACQVKTGGRACSVAPGSCSRRTGRLIPAETAPGT